ncbi:NIL domain-containing protein [Chloroflexota bacterium]
MAKRQVMFTFTEEAIAEPIIYNVAQQFNLVVNIRRADLTEDMGWILLELEGEDSNIEDGIAWAISRGVRVESADEERA